MAKREHIRAVRHAADDAESLLAIFASVTDSWRVENRTRAGVDGLLGRICLYMRIEDD